MKAILIFVFAAVAVSSVQAISCYKCLPDFTKQAFCDKPTTVVNCDNEPPSDLGKYDSCLEGRFTFDFQGKTMKGGLMMCMVQNVCEREEARGCEGLERSYNKTWEQCDVECCLNDECNDGIPPTTAAPTDAGTSNGASLVIFVTLLGLFYSIFVR